MDKESFAEYWNEAVLALIYDVHQMKPPLRMAQINRCWRRELLDCRFFSTGIRHGAAAWLSSLQQAAPHKAAAVRKALHSATFHVGANAAHAGLALAGAAVTATGGWMTAHLQDTAAKASGVATGLLGLGMLAKTGVELYALSDPERLCQRLREEADQQLASILAML